MTFMHWIIKKIKEIGETLHNLIHFDDPNLRYSAFKNRLILNYIIKLCDIYSVFIYCNDNSKVLKNGFDTDISNIQIYDLFRDNGPAYPIVKFNYYGKLYLFISPQIDVRLKWNSSKNKYETSFDDLVEVKNKLREIKKYTKLIRFIEVLIR